MRAVFLFLTLLCLPVPVMAADTPLLESAKVTDIPLHATLQTAKNSYKLDSICVPAAEMKNVDRLLREKTVRQTVGFYSQGEKDRHGRILTDDVKTQDGTSLLELLLQSGYALQCTQDNLRAFEKMAETDKKGLWKDGPLDTDKISKKDLNDIHIIEGVIADVAERRDMTYFNFGADWKTDFTAQLSNKKTAGFPPALSLKGKRVRVRGYVYERNGAMIDLEYPAQMEIIDP